MRSTWGVIVVDMQGDFTKWKQGNLAVPGSDEGYVRRVEAATRQFKELGALIFATQDWHASDHVSFASSHQGKRPLETIMIDGEAQVLWPSHCVQGTENARVLIDNNLFLAIVKSGQKPDVESYSFYQDRKGTKTEMDAMLRINGVKNIVIYGIATEYCVRATALDLVAANYKTIVVKSLCLGVSSGAAAAAFDEMGRNGIRVVAGPDEVCDEMRCEQGLSC